MDLNFGVIPMGHRVLRNKQLRQMR